MLPGLDRSPWPPRPAGTKRSAEGRGTVAAGPLLAGPPVAPNSNPLFAAPVVSDVRGVLGAVLLAEPGGPGLSGAGGDAVPRGRQASPSSGVDELTEGQCRALRVRDCAEYAAWKVQSQPPNPDVPAHANEKKMSVS